MLCTSTKLAGRSISCTDHIFWTEGEQSAVRKGKAGRVNLHIAHGGPGLLWFRSDCRGRLWTTSTTCTGIQARWRMVAAHGRELFPDDGAEMQRGVSVGVTCPLVWMRPESMPDGKEPPRCVCLKATHEGIPVVVHVTSARDFATLENLKLFSKMHHKLLQLFVDMGLCVKQVGTPVFSHRLAAIRHVRASGHRKLLVGVALRTLFHAERAFQKHTQEILSSTSRSRREVIVNSGPLCAASGEYDPGNLPSVPRSPRGVIVNGKAARDKLRQCIHWDILSVSHRKFWSTLGGCFHKQQVPGILSSTSRSRRGVIVDSGSPCAANWRNTTLVPGFSYHCHDHVCCMVPPTCPGLFPLEW